MRIVEHDYSNDSLQHKKPVINMPTNILKRKHGDEPSLSGARAEESPTALILSSGEFPQPPNVNDIEMAPHIAEGVPASVHSACRAASVRSPSASRAVLAKYRSILNHDLLKILESVGGYDCEVASNAFPNFTPFYCVCNFNRFCYMIPYI